MSEIRIRDGPEEWVILEDVGLTTLQVQTVLRQCRTDAIGLRDIDEVERAFGAAAGKTVVIRRELGDRVVYTIGTFNTPENWVERHRPP